MALSCTVTPIQVWLNRPKQSTASVCKRLPACARLLQQRSAATLPSRTGVIRSIIMPWVLTLVTTATRGARRGATRALARREGREARVCIVIRRSK